MKAAASPQKAEAAAPQEKAPERAVSPVQRLQRGLGNFGMQCYVQAKLHVGGGDDPLEREADRVADQVTGKAPCACGGGGGGDCEECSSSPRQVARSAAPHARGARSVPDSVIASLGGGARLDAGTRAAMQTHFGVDFAGVRVHTGDADALRAESIGARAFTYGSDVVFARGQYRPGTSEGTRLLAHELTHVVQQTGGTADGAAASVHGSAPKAQQIHAKDGDPDPPVKLPSAETLEIPIERLKSFPKRDLLVGVFGTSMVAIPLQGEAWTIVPPAGTGRPVDTAPAPTVATPVLTIPTVGKEGLVAVKVNGNAAFLIDAGGSPLVVSPAALAAIRSALGVSSFSGVVITHVHGDHIQSLVEIVRSGQIRPENIYYAQAFENVLRPYLAALRADASLAPLGYTATTTFSTFATPAAGTWFRETRVEGDMVFDYYALTGPMRTLQAASSTSGLGKTADTASLLTRVTHTPTGMAVLYVGDLRGADLGLFQAAMGPAYDQMLSGVRVIQGLQHHLGALEGADTAAGRADRAGLTDLLVRTLMQSGQLTVMAQSSESYSGRQFLNKSLIAGLNALGIDVEVAREGTAASMGTITIDTAGGVTRAGGGAKDSFPGAATARAEFSRLQMLRQAEAVLTRYGSHVSNWQQMPNMTPAEVTAARTQLEAELTAFITSTIANVGKDAAARSSLSLANPTAQAAALLRLQGIGTGVTDRMGPAYMETLRELNRLGPHLDTYKAEMEAARTTGRLSDKGIDALWEIDPAMAQRLVKSSSLPRAERRRVSQQLPGAPTPGGTRAVAGILLFIEVANLVAPVVQQAQDSAFNEDVVQGMNDILWWQEKGVFPSLQGVNDNVFSNEMTTDPGTINSWISDSDIDYLTMTGIDDGYWDAFMIWASANIRNFRDWEHYVVSPDTVQGAGEYVDQKQWSYRKGVINDNTFSYSITTSYQHNERLTLILNAAAGAMVKGTEEELATREKEEGAGMRPAYSAPGFSSRPSLNNLPQATGRRRFAPGVTPRLFTLAGQRERTGYNADAVFYVFPKSAAREPVPAGYVVVAGADYNTYAQVYLTRARATAVGINQYGNEFSYEHGFESNPFEILLALENELVAAE